MWNMGKMWNWWFTPAEPPPPMVLVPPLFDFPPLAARTRLSSMTNIYTFFFSSSSLSSNLSQFNILNKYWRANDEMQDVGVIL